MKYRFVVSEADISTYAELSGDWNPIHFDREASQAAGLRGPCAHGMLVTSRGLAMLHEDGMLLEAYFSKAEFTFLAPVLAGAEVCMEAERDENVYKLTFYSESIIVIKGRITI